MTETERIKQIISYSDRQKQHEKGNYITHQLIINSLEVHAIIAEQLTKIIAILKDIKTV